MFIERKTKESFINEFKRYSSRDIDNFLKQCEILNSYKEEGFFKEVILEIGLDKGTSYRMASVHNMSLDVQPFLIANVKPYQLLELTNKAFQGYNGEYLINYVVQNNMSVRDIKKWAKELKGTPPKPKASEFEVIKSKVDKLSKEDKLRLIEILKEEMANV